MITALRRTLADLLDPRLTWTLLKSLALSAAAYAAVWALAWWLIMRSRWAEAAWLDHTLHILGGAGVMALSLLLFPSVFVVLQSLFLDGLADRIEARHYPHMGAARGTGLREGLLMAVRVMLLMVAVNLLMLPVYIAGSLFFGAGMMLYYAVNGWLCGQEYYAQAAMRRMTRKEVRQWSARNRLTIWMTGTIITLLGTVPVVNFAAPAIGCALVVHMARLLRPPRA
jgi:uncharacterized protein involved in cysteine biosynthesis